jgi:hypothetical protein
MLVATLDEECFTVSFNGAIGKDQQHAVFLVEPGEVKEVGILFEVEVGIPVTRHFIVAVEDGNGAGFHLAAELFAVADEELWADWFVPFHGMSLKMQHYRKTHLEKTGAPWIYVCGDMRGLTVSANFDIRQ